MGHGDIADHDGPRAAAGLSHDVADDLAYETALHASSTQHGPARPRLEPAVERVLRARLCRPDDAAGDDSAGRAAEP